MAVTQARWTEFGARDIHLTPGLTSPKLIQILEIFSTVDNRWHYADSVNNESHVSVTFSAAFVGAPAVHDVHLNTSTGEVAVANQLSAGFALRSFIVTATAKQGSTTLTASVRIYVHKALTARWLTPATLTVRKDAANMRFSVLAKFDDGVIGDITNWGILVPSGSLLQQDFVHRTSSNQAVHHWSVTDVPATAISITEDTGEVRCHDSTSVGTVHLLDESGTVVASAPVTAAPPWSTPTEVIFVDGPGADQATQPNVRNVLFLPDGFVTDADQKAFGVYVRKLVNLLRTSPFTRPYNLLRDSINYFSAWVPSPEAGITAFEEVYTEKIVNLPDENGVNAQFNRGPPVELPILPSVPPPATLTLEQLIATVGLPSIMADPPGSPAGTDADGRVHDWQTLYGSTPTLSRTAGVYADWLLRDTHVLLNERNSAFHSASSFRPRIDMATFPGALVGFHPLRLTDTDLDAFLKALTFTDRSGTSVPMKTWAAGGNDEALVVILCRTSRLCGTGNSRSGSRTARYICLSMDVLHVHDYAAKPGRPGIELRPDDIPPEPPMSALGTVAHELAHSFRLDDEYGGQAAYPADGSLDGDLKPAPNTQPRSELLIGNALATDKIKWRWHRISAAGVLADPPPDPPGSQPKPPARLDHGDIEKMILTLAKDHHKQFAVNDVIRLRTADLSAAGLLVSSRLQVVSIDATRGELHVKRADILHVNPSHYPSGSVVLVPARRPDPPGGLGDDLLMVANVVADRINDSHNPLNAAPGDPPGQHAPHGGVPVPTPASNFLPGQLTVAPNLSYQIVGIYDGGHTFDDGVYHPTGACLMNETTLQDGPGKVRLSEFCPVCRYAMVDLLDPTKHKDIDAEYSRRYPG